MGLITRAIATQALISVVAAQATSSNTTCADIEPLAAINASTTRQIPALRVVGSQTDAKSDPFSRFAVETDNSGSWELKLGIKPFDNYNETVPGTPYSVEEGYDIYQYTALLDTGDSNLTGMGVCHSIISPLSFRGFVWTKDVVAASLNATGDCTGWLNQECIDSLKRYYKEQAATRSLMGEACSYPHYAPPECPFYDVSTEMIPLNTTISTQANSTSNSTTSLDSSLECDGLNVSSTHEARVGLALANYDRAVRFTSVNIITFWPNRSSDGVYNSNWTKDIHAEVQCLTPDNIAKNSRTPSDAQTLLDQSGKEFPVANGASGKYVSLGWLGVAVLSGMMLL